MSCANRVSWDMALIDPGISVPCKVCKMEASYIDEKTREPLCYKHWHERGYEHNGASRNFITDEQIKSVGKSMREGRERAKQTKKRWTK